MQILPGDIKNFLMHAFGIQNGHLIVRRVDVPIPNLPRALDGLRIGQICDLHLGPATPLSRVEQAVTLINAEAPDLVALTGDFVDDPLHIIGYAEVLALSQSRLGCFACLGNHDLYHNADTIAAPLQASGIKVLRNQYQLVTVGGAQLCIVGIDDIGTNALNVRHVEPADDLTAALAGSPFSDVIRVLLAHNPDFVMEPVFARETARRPIQLVLSGHTHGGQVQLPLIGAPFLPSRYGQMFSGGLVQVAGTQVYVSRGAGASWPVRFNCPPEVNVLTLRSA